MKSALIGVLALGLVPCYAASEEPVPSRQNWSEKMKSLQKSLQELLIDLSSDKRFNSPANFKRIEKNAEKIAKLAHTLQPKEASPDRDPSIEIIGKLFAQEADHAYKTLAWGHRAYARTILRSLSGYCIACHTRGNQGPSFDTTSAAFKPLIDSLNELERADYFAASRQFDLASQEYGKVVSSPTHAEKKPFEWERAIRSALLIAVRVKKDPAQASSIVEKILATKKAPYFLREQATEWKKSIEKWKEELKATPQTEEGYYTQAIRLTADARALQKYPADRSADILYLRASSAVHELLSRYPTGARVPDALYLAGLSYEVLNSVPLWDLEEYYYLACIHKVPHTDKARQCYRRYEESVYLGYTGSGGIHIPADIQEKLKVLDQLSDPNSGRTLE